MRIAIALALGVLTVSPAAAQTIELAEPGFVLPYGEEVELSFTPEGDYASARLAYEVRMDSPKTAGSTYVMGLALNGQPVNAAATRHAVRLFNKPIEAIMPNGLRIPWAQGGNWRAVYAPDFTPLGYQGEIGGELVEVSAYRFVIDITDLVRRGEQNTLTISNRALSMNLRSYFPDDNPTLDLIFNELTIELSDEPPVIAAPGAGEEFSADRIMIQPPATARVIEVAAVADGGGMTLALPGLGVEVVSRFSYEGGGFNTMPGAGAPAGQEGWRVSRTGGEDIARVAGQAPDYQVERTVRFAGDHLVIEDHLRNRTDRDIGLAWAHELRAPLTQIEDAYLCGNPDPATTELRGYENSTAFITGEQAGCGLLALDDVARVQGVFYWDAAGAAGVRSDVFCLPAGGEYTLRWAVYPVLRPDYFDFINLCRRDLGVNFTVPGGFSFDLTSFATAEPGTLREMVQQRALAIVCSGTFANVGGDPPYYHGEHMLQAQSLIDRYRTACARAREITPEVTTLVYMHSFIDTDPQTPEKHPDALITNADGTPYIQPSYTQRFGINFYYAYPAIGNSYLDAMKRVVDMIMDDIGADGIYWDELEMISPTRTYDRWDGHSAELDGEHRIARKFGDPQLLSLEAKAALIEYIFAKGGALIGNSCPRTATLTDYHFPRFVETAALWYPARAHLYTPIALGDHLTVNSFDDLLRDIRDKLMWGGLYYYYSAPAHPHPTITQHMFPFTPVELHRGWLLGQERLITCVPGTFTLGDDAPVTVYWYGADGALTDRTGEERVEDGRRLVRLALGEGEMAVVERR
ncbi:MAG: hypothetical protein AB7Y46_03470 [Armatimonadota bacterium]